MAATVAPAIDVPATAPLGPISRAVAWLDAQGSQAWLWVAGFAVAIFAWAEGGWWLVGRSPVGHIDQAIVSGVPYAPVSLAAVLAGRKIVRRALDDFWPATGWAIEAKAVWSQAFGPLRVRDEWLAMLVGIIGGSGAFAGAIGAVIGANPRPVDYAAGWPPYVVGYVVSTVSIATAVRWLRAVSRIHAQATAIDPFDRAPIYAFSRLTVFLGVYLLAIAYYSLAVNYASQKGNVAFLAFLVSAMALGVLAFVAPLWGIHGRLVRSKHSLEVDVERRINTLAAEIYGRIDGGNVDAASSLNATLSGLMTLRDRVGRLPTWPWPPQVLRGFLTALLLPLLVVVGGRFISTLLGT